MTDQLEARLRDLAEPLAQSAGLDLVDVAVKGNTGAQKVRIAVDRKGGVDLGTCQSLARALSSALDAADPIQGRYELEVTSPGVDHPLRGRRAFERVEGRDVLVHRGEQGGRMVQVRGRVVGADERAVVLDVEGGVVEVPYEEIVKATQALPW